jgi:hypothetical protein
VAITWGTVQTAIVPSEWDGTKFVGTMTVTVPTGAQALVVYVLPDALSAVKWDGAALDPVAHAETGNLISLGIYDTLNPTAGTAALTIEFDGNRAWLVVARCIVSGLDTTTPRRTAGQANAFGTSPSVTLATQAGDEAIDFVALEGSVSSLTPNGGRTTDLAAMDLGGLASAAASRTTASGSSTAMDWTGSPGNFWCIAAVAYIPAAGGGSTVLASASGLAAASASVGRYRPVVPAALSGLGTASVALGRRRPVVAAPITGLANAAAVLGRRRGLTLAPVLGISTASVALARLRHVVLGTVSGSASTAATLRALRALGVSATGTAQATVTLARLARTLSPDLITGTSAAAVTVTGRRALSARAVGTATVAVPLGRLGVLAVGSTGSTSVLLTLTGRRTTTLTGSAGTATAAVGLGRWRATAAIVTGAAAVSVQLTVRRAVSVTVAGTASVSVSAAARRALLVSSAGSADVAAALDRVTEATSVAVRGKYGAEHRSALALLGDARGFAADHARVRQQIAQTGA